MVRTNPPIAALHLSGTYNATLASDPWKELKAEGVQDQIVKGLKIDTTQTMTPELQAKLTKALEEYNLKHYNATCINIDGLDELGLQMEIDGFKARIAEEPDAGIAAFLKGTRFNGKSRSMNSVIKSNLPGNVVVKSGVKFSWELADLVRYACAVREALERSGVVQPKSGFAGIKTGILKGFGVYPIDGP